MRSQTTLVTGRWVTVRTSFVGFHAWPAAPLRRKYLRDAHRHLFKVEARLAVGHDDRECEFHDVLDVVRDAVKQWDGTDRSASSCELMAGEIGSKLARAFKRAAIVTVSEDGECDGSVEVQWIPL